MKAALSLDLPTGALQGVREEVHEEDGDSGGAGGDQRLRRRGPQGATLTNVNTPAPSAAYTAWSQGTCGADTKWERVTGGKGGLSPETGGCSTDLPDGFPLSQQPPTLPSSPEDTPGQRGVLDSLCAQGASGEPQDDSDQGGTGRGSQLTCTWCSLHTQPRTQAGRGRLSLLNPCCPPCLSLASGRYLPCRHTHPCPAWGLSVPL